MEIRPASEQDIPAIVALLKESLGDGLMAKSESFWRWKHIQNPFGPSPVLIATTGKEIIGVRAFMRWEWRCNGSVLRAVRAVDTATHPGHQGKGIFTRLTRALVSQSKEEGTDFIFNTPNKLSRPGYLKMGWRDVGRMPLRISPHWGFRPSSVFREEDYGLELYLNSPDLQLLLDDYRCSSEKSIITHYSPEYLRWRYLLNPNIRYFASGSFSGSSSFLFICRIKYNARIKELRVCDAFVAADVKKKDMKDSLKELACASGAHAITFSGERSSFPLAHFFIALGPHVTARDLNSKENRGHCLNVKRWQPSLGDMEVF